MALQLSLLLKGSWAESSFLVIGPVLSEYLPEQNDTETEIATTMLPMTTILPTEELNEDVHNGSLVIFDRVYDAGILIMEKILLKFNFTKFLKKILILFQMHGIILDACILPV